MSTNEVTYTYVLDTPFSIYQAVHDVLVARGYWKRLGAKASRYNLMLGDRFLVNYGLAREGSLKLINYYKGSHLLTLKSAMAKMLPRYPAVPWLPETFVLPTEKDDFLQAAAVKPRVWILKPSAGCKGEGIVMERDASAVMALVEAAPPRASFVAQEYVSNPLLIHGRKFDIRMWVLVTPAYEVFCFSQGSLRTCSVPFTQWAPDDDPLAHLTNHCLQENGADFGKYEPGNEMWYDEFETYLRDNDTTKKGLRFREDILPEMEGVVATCFREAKELLEVPLSASSSLLCFQLFGFDFMLRDDGSVVLIEINGSPASAEKWQKPLVDGIVRVVVDPYFPPPPGADIGHPDPHAYWYRVM